jgi:hypothetical protein
MRGKVASLPQFCVAVLLVCHCYALPFCWQYGNTGCLVMAISVCKKMVIYVAGNTATRLAGILAIRQNGNEEVRHS